MPTLGIYAPLPGSRSGIADYAQYTASALADTHDLSFVSLTNYVSPTRFDHVLYHVGNGIDSAAAFRALGERSGPVILHEYVLSQFFVEHHALLDERTNQKVRDAFGVVCGHHFRNSKDLDFLMRTERQLGLHYMDVGLERLIVERASVVLVHSRVSVDVLRQRYGCIIQLLDFPAEPLPTEGREVTRESLGIPYGATIFGSFGFVGANKQLPTILDAWAALGPDPADRHLLLVGAGVCRLDSATTPSVSLVDYIPDPNRFADLLGAIDVGIQLRSPTLGETSGVASSLLTSSVPVIVDTESILPAWAPQRLVHIVAAGAECSGQLASAIAERLHHNADCKHAYRENPLVRWRARILSARAISPPRPRYAANRASALGR